MQISQKTHYALLALFELALKEGEGPMSIAAIAEARGVSPQFLQAILRQLRQGGFVESFRGKEGGYRLARHPRRLTMGEVIRFLEGPIVPLDSIDEAGAPLTERGERDPFGNAWGEVARAVNAIYDRITLADIVEQSRQSGSAATPDFVI